MSALWRFHGGMRLQGHKSLSRDSRIIAANLPEHLVIPLLQHIGVPAKPVVKVGDKILKSQIIARCGNAVCTAPGSAPVHASTSGTVTAIEPRLVPHPSGLTAPCIVIETDGKDTWDHRDPIPDCTHLSIEDLRQRIAEAGIVGLGGAGFPAHQKLKPGDIDTLILNGAECEPYISCDNRLMQERPREILLGAKILSQALGGTKRCIIAMEDDKPEAFKTLRALAKQHVELLNLEVVQVPTLYPMGGERQLIKVLTGREAASLPFYLGMVVHNVGTAAAIFRAVRQDEPLISRIVTVAGDGVRAPQNLEVLLGTPISALLDQCGRRDMPIERLLMGGPMMGVALPDENVPVVKTTNCVIAYTAKNFAREPAVRPCIRCGACENVCPANLLPQQLYWYGKAKDLKKAEKYRLFDCIECGCCAYVCPSHIPLVQYFRHTKGLLRATEQDRREAEKARKRHTFRDFRLTREKAERKARQAKKKAALNSSPSAGDKERKKAVIQAALERAKAKKSKTAAADNTGNNTD
ncbi:MAG: electron transport complex subunit RsxC [Gammaproteobacteria bacterium]|nr:electron transport complex subunit RsxC [Gammaproteobacteria bacterium]